ncbi:MAG: macro domain-containing protein [Methylotenera sp.]|nr:macro domain-containing protein [Methylotenera sp.]
MITFTHGNLLEAPAEALVNTVNTVGVMGKGIALMFKERFALNYQEYVKACKAGWVQTGKVFVTETHELSGPRWIVNFPTKQHWRADSRMEWVVDGLYDLRRFILEKQIKSIAIPPLGAGNGGLDWLLVREKIEQILSDLPTEILVFEPNQQYQNVAKRDGVKTLTPARALIAELVRRYWVMGMECSLLEVQKLAWFMERAIEQFNPQDNPLKLNFKAHIYGPYAQNLAHLLNSLDGSYLHCEKRISDADKLDVIWFEESSRTIVQAFINTEAKSYLYALEYTEALIDGFESPFGMELLATVDWLLFKEKVNPDLLSVRKGLEKWPGGAGARKNRLFDDRAIQIALERLTNPPVIKTTHHIQ